MICEFCGGQTVTRKVKKQHWLGGKLVENVEAEVCAEGGERYFHATVLDRIDKLLTAEHTVKERLLVEVMSFA